MMKRLVGACWIQLVLASAVSAQTRAGGEFRVSSAPYLGQQLSGADMAPDGDFVIVWDDSFRGDSAFGRRFAASGVPQGGDFPISNHTVRRQTDPIVAFGARKDYVVIWLDNQPLTSTTQMWPDGQPLTASALLGRRYNAAGSAVGGDFQVVSFTTDYRFLRRPSMGRASDGSFVVSWDSPDADGSGTGVVGRRFDRSANPLGLEFLVNAYTTADQYGGEIAVAPNGAVVAVWSDESGRDGSLGGIMGQRFDASGNRLGGEFQVNTYTTGDQYGNSVGVSSSGAFVVTWNSYGGIGPEVFARRFDSSGSPLGSDFVVNSYTRGGFLADVALDARGNFVVAWDSLPADGSRRSVFAQRFSRSGARRGAEFQVNSSTTVSVHPMVISDSVGNFVVTWDRSFAEFVSVSAQRFGGLGPAALAVDSIGNHVLEPGETAEVRPTWRNFNGAAQTFGGALSEMTGPAGATYTIVDPSGDYGTVSNGTTQQCAQCYAVGVSDPATRPALHWDASVVETIVPDAQGQQKEWRLHVGRTFTDVATTNPFYPFIETLLHNGVTAGCGGTSYCPSASTTRAQVSVFVLVAKEAAGYTPQACGTPMFADVPASSPFCRYVEELARRGVVTGCGGGNYCPGTAVTRDQMAVFVLRTLDPALNPPTCGTPMFGDVPASSPFCRWIEELARRGVVSGCGAGNYCPASAVTREQMGVFISATFGLTLYGP